MRTKFDNEIGELEQSEKEAKSRYCEVKAKLLEYEDVLINLRATVKQLENQLANSQGVSWNEFPWEVWEQLLGCLCILKIVFSCE